jgi:hypothetical protein
MLWADSSPVRIYNICMVLMNGSKNLLTTLASLKNVKYCLIYKTDDYMFVIFGKL